MSAVILIFAAGCARWEIVLAAVWILGNISLAWLIWPWARLRGSVVGRVLLWFLAAAAWTVIWAVVFDAIAPYSESGCVS